MARKRTGTDQTKRPGRTARRPARRSLGLTEPKLKVWIVFGGRVKIGEGRTQFLELIDHLGSIQAAAERSAMSYRNAWGYLKELEEAAGVRFLERRRGAGLQRGTRLTEEGKQFVRRLRRFQREVGTAAARTFKRVFS